MNFDFNPMGGGGGGSSILLPTGGGGGGGGGPVSSLGALGLGFDGLGGGLGGGVGNNANANSGGATNPYAVAASIAAAAAAKEGQSPGAANAAAAGGVGGVGVGAGAAAAESSDRVYQLILDLTAPLAATGSPADRRELALVELSKKREAYEDLAPILWHSFGVMTALLQEIVLVYPLLSPPTLSNQASNRVCNALALLQCVASHPDTRALFLNADIPLFLYPFLNTTSKTRAFEYLRLTSLGVIGALVKTDNSEVINFLLSTEIIPLCLRIMESGSELSKTVAIFIVQKILLDEMGLAYICQTYERFFAVGTVLSNMVSQLVDQQSVRLLKHVVRCYLRLSDNPRAKEALRQCLPEPLRDNSFAMVLKDDLTTKRCLAKDASSGSAPSSTNAGVDTAIEADEKEKDFPKGGGLGGGGLGIGARFRSRTDTNQVANAHLLPATTATGLHAHTHAPTDLPSTSSKSGSSLPVPSTTQRPASEGSSRAPSADELEAFVTHTKDKLKAHPYLSSFTDLDIKRFLIAHRNNQSNATKQLQATLDWRQSFNFNQILNEDFSDLETTGKLVIDSTDYQQNAIMVWQQHRHTPLLPAAASTNSATSSSTTAPPTPSNPSKHAKKEEKEAHALALQQSIDRNLRFFVYTIERAKQTHRLRSDNRLIVIVDRIGMTPANYDQPLGKAIVGVMPHYPELFESYYVFPKNAMLMVAWKVTRVFLDPVTVARIKLLGESEVPTVLGEIMPKGELLVRYGGEKMDGLASSSSGGCVIGTGSGGGETVCSGTGGANDLVVEDMDDDDDDEFHDADGE
ncbi:UNVERIFIED_CONTAM: hypothetical protein HDU68_008653 [Siphonaria sp. JEL0065]|nr:hypothetical protein HDU68_008653 [Siphonaria sp. JEL0065]